MSRKLFHSLLFLILCCSTLPVFSQSYRANYTSDGFSGYIDFEIVKQHTSFNEMAYKIRNNVKNVVTSYKNGAHDKELAKAGITFPITLDVTTANNTVRILANAYFYRSPQKSSQHSSQPSVTLSLYDGYIQIPDFSEEAKEYVVKYAKEQQVNLWKTTGGLKNFDVTFVALIDLKNQVQKAIREAEKSAKAEQEALAKEEEEKNTDVAARESEEDSATVSENEEVTTSSSTWSGTEEEEDDGVTAERSSASTTESVAARQAREQREEQLRRQRIKNDYDARIQAQRQTNTAIAGSAATSSAGILVLLGGFMYQNMGAVSPEQIFSGGNGYFGVDFGYGVNLTPMYFNSVLTQMDNNAQYHTTKSVMSGMPFITNINFRLKGGYEHVYGGGYVFGGVAPGASLIFHAFELSGYFGARAYAGMENIKLLAEYEQGYRSLSLNPYIDPEESGLGKTRINLTNLKLGIKFSWYSSSYASARNHLTLGIINETINTDIEPDSELGKYWIRNVYPDPDDEQTGLFSLLKNDQPSYTGYWLEWHHDHYGILTFKFFPDYPHTGFASGTLGDDFDDDTKFAGITISYTRAIDSFF